MDLEPTPPGEPPGAWPPGSRAMRAIARPLSRFLHVQAASGVVLLLAALVALGWVNLISAESYERFWHTELHLGVGGWVFSRSLHFWINDGLMALFFFVVGLEIRREMHAGELSDLRRAALPIAAAVGGMLVPAAIYLGFNHTGSPARAGWGVPMATDIAFAVGALALLGARVRPALRVLLLALAIVDDIGAILVIAVFYAQGFSLAGLGIAAAGVALVWLMQRFGVRSPWTYVPAGVVVWVGLLVAGIHPTLAGVLLGLLTPAQPWLGPQRFLAAAASALAQFRARFADQPREPAALIGPLAQLSAAHHEALAPVTRLEAALHPWVAFGVMPLFALANAGVALGGGSGEHGSSRLTLGVVAGLVLGKPVGILLATALVVRLGWTKLPRGVTWAGVTVVGLVAGIGFTMAIFIAGLAFAGSEALLATAKLAVLGASGAAMVVALVAGRVLLAPGDAAAADGAAPTVDDAEAATEA